MTEKELNDLLKAKCYKFNGPPPIYYEEGCNGVKVFGNAICDSVPAQNTCSLSKGVSINLISICAYRNIETECDKKDDGFDSPLCKIE